MSPRATPMSLPERRAAIVAAVLPLLEEHGADLSTRQIAEAAGIAEGTVFRAFGNKEALMEAAIAAAFETGPLIDALREIDPELPLRERLVAAVEANQARLRSVFRVLQTMRMPRPPDLPGDAADQQRRRADAETAYGLLVELVRPDAAALRYPPEEAAHRLRLVVFAATHPVISDGRSMSAEQIVDFALDGVRHPHPGSP